MSSVLVLINQVVCCTAVTIGYFIGSILKLFKRKPSLSIDPNTDNFAPYFEAPLNIDQGTMPTTQFTGFPTEFAEQVGKIYGASGFIGSTGSTGFNADATRYERPKKPEPKPEPLNLDGERVIDME